MKVSWGRLIVTLPSLILLLFSGLQPPLSRVVSQTPISPPGILYYVPITLTNSQNSPTPSPFQQMVQINSASFSTYEASNLQNIEFFDSNGNVIPSWLESGNSNTATSTVYWLSLSSRISAGSSVTVYMGFAATSTNLMNNQLTGEAPDLSNPAGTYDDGNNVFLAYADFDLGFGSWAPYSAAGSFVPTATNNGVEMLGGQNGEETFVVPQTNIPKIPVTIEYSWEYSGDADQNSVSVFGLSPITSGINSAGVGNGCPMKDAVCADYWYYNSVSYLSQSIAGNNIVAQGSFAGRGTFHIVSQLTVSDSTSATAGYIIGALSLDNFPQTPVPALLSGSIPNPFGNPTLMIFAFDGGSSSYQYLHWIVARANPPNGIMPSVAVGTPTFQTSTTSSQSAATTIITTTTTTATSIGITTATLTSTNSIVSTVTLPASTVTSQLPASTVTATISKTVTPTIAQTANVTSSQSTANPPPPLSPIVYYALGGVLVVFVAFVLVRVVFWKVINEKWLNKGV